MSIIALGLVGFALLALLVAIVAAIVWAVGKSR